MKCYFCNDCINSDNLTFNEQYNQYICVNCLNENEHEIDIEFLQSRPVDIKKYSIFRLDDTENKENLIYYYRNQE
jgi:protein-arginine kinase activator protein McsA